MVPDTRFWCPQRAAVVNIAIVNLKPYFTKFLLRLFCKLHKITLPEIIRFDSSCIFPI